MNPLVLASSGEPLLEQTLLILFVISSVASKLDAVEGFLLILNFSDSALSSSVSQSEHLRSTPSSSSFAVVIGTAESEKDIIITCSPSLSASCSYSSSGRLTINIG